METKKKPAAKKTPAKKEVEKKETVKSKKPQTKKPTAISEAEAEAAKKSAKKPAKKKKITGTVATKKPLQVLKAFFLREHNPQRLMSHFQGANCIRILKQQGDECFISLNGNYILYNRVDNTGEDFGPSLTCKIFTEADIPWKNSTEA